MVGSFDLFGSYTKFKDMVKAIDPDLVKEILEAERTVCEAIGLRGAEAPPPGRSVLVGLPAPLAGWQPALHRAGSTEYAFVARTENAEGIRQDARDRLPRK